MSNGTMLRQLREMADRKEVSPEQAFPLMMAAMADIYEEQMKSKEWRKDADERMDKLESKDTRFVAVVAGASSVLGALIALIGVLIVSA